MPDATAPPESPYEREVGYAVRYRDTRFQVGTGARTHRREAKVIADLLLLANRIQTPGQPWLDMPSGAGRLTGLLPAGSVQVDRNLAMLRAAATGDANADGTDRACARAVQLPFPDATFAGVLSMRLFQHIPTSAERVAILTELRRVTSGPLIVSFFDAISVPNLRRTLRRRFLGRRDTGRTAVMWRTFRVDLGRAGWRVVVARPLVRFLSEQCILLAK